MNKNNEFRQYKARTQNRKKVSLGDLVIPSERRKEWRLAHPKTWELISAERTRDYHRQYRQKNRLLLNIKKRLYYTAIRLEGIAAYGGKCQCCGESQVEFLTIDHINGRTDEIKHGGLPLTGKKLWSRMKTLGWPKEHYQLLCFNCNCAKGIYGKCPHARDSTAPVLLLAEQEGGE